jgi:enoyl-CoA hydratase/carnithine racemase
MTVALDTVEADHDAVGLVSIGEGKFYSNGLDLDWLKEPDTEPMVDFVRALERLFARLLTFPLVAVAACNGHVFAGGAILALCHDLRVMRADRGFFCLPEVDVKILFTPGTDSLIRSTLPRTVAREFIFTGKRIGGTDAAARQIMNEAVSEADVADRAVTLAQEHGGKDRHVLAALKGRMYTETLGYLANSPGAEPVHLERLEG